jgi:hypothetical protein
VQTAKLVKVAIGKLRNGDKLVVSPAFSDIELGRILSNGGLLGNEMIYQLDFVLIFVLILVTFRQFQKHGKVCIFSTSVALRVYL